MEKGIVTNVDEPTDWLNNIVIIEKPDKSLRIYLDPQHLNKNIVEENFPIPTLDEITPKLLNKSVYTVLDFKDGFWQLELTESCNNLCSFSSPIGTLKFNKLPFGIKTAPMVFQKYNVVNPWFKNYRLSIFKQDCRRRYNTCKAAPAVDQQQLIR